MSARLIQPGHGRGTAATHAFPGAIAFILVVTASTLAGATHSPAASQAPAAKRPASGASAPILATTNAVPRSVFHEIDPYKDRDPFCRVGYKRPPKGTREVVEQTAPVVTIKLKIAAILGKTVTLANGPSIQEGGTYNYVDAATKTTVQYKVLRVNEDSVVILYGDKESEIKMQGQRLEDFQEKEPSGLENFQEKE